MRHPAFPDSFHTTLNSALSKKSAICHILTTSVGCEAANGISHGAFLDVLWNAAQFSLVATEMRTRMDITETAVTKKRRAT